MKIMILMKMILILLFMSHFWLGLMNLINAKHLKKKDNQRINGLLKDGEIFACQKMRKKKQNQFLLRNAFSARHYYTIWQYRDILALKDSIQFKNLYQIFLTDLPREQKVSIPLHQNVSILFVNNKYIGNILTTMMAVIVMEVKARSLY